MVQRLSAFKGYMCTVHVHIALLVTVPEQTWLFDLFAGKLHVCVFVPFVTFYFNFFLQWSLQYFFLSGMYINSTQLPLVNPELQNCKTQFSSRGLYNIKRKIQPWYTTTLKESRKIRVEESLSEIRQKITKLWIFLIFLPVILYR